jgi:hypothetical protein
MNTKDSTTTSDSYTFAFLLREAREVILDGSTPYLRELQRRVETPEDSISFEEFMAHDCPDR